jgi:tetratricopeptide (TPR) repeat protein/ADP-heptose:LPS heptosyltransferase
MNDTATIERAMVKHRNGDLAGAQQMYAHILEDHPDDVAALHLMGVLSYQRQESAEAETYFRRCIAIAPSYAAAFGNLGLVLAGAGRSEEAVDLLRRSLGLDPAQPGVWSNLGMTLVRLGKFGEAAEACRTALSYDPGSADAYCNLSNALRGSGRYPEALDAASRAIGLRAGFAEAVNSKGNILAEMDRIPEACEAYEHALALRPGYLSPMNNLARIHREEGDLDRARVLYQKAIAVDPSSAEAHWGLAFVQLLAGDLASGWQEYAWRWKLDTVPDARIFPSERWDGRVVPQLTLLLVCEQGLGDALQFIRFASSLAEHGMHVWVEAPDALVRLFENIKGIERVIPRGAALPVHDAHCSLLDLPRLCGTTLNTIPSRVPYIGIPDRERRVWDARIVNDPEGFRVGLAWAGSAGHINDRRRTCGAGAMLPLAGVEGTVLYDLQKEGLSKNALVPFHPSLVDHSAAFHDVQDTAGLIAQLDLVITVDTMVAHLAGALGKPVWLLLPFAPDWRWMLGRDDTPWYPGMRLFRQRQAGDWTSLIDVIRGELHALVNRREIKPRTSTTPGGITEGLRHHEAGEITHAESCYKQVLTSAPDDPDALYLLSVACHQTGAFEEGIRCARRLLGSHPAHAEGWNSLGNLLHDTGRNDEAEHAFREALRIRADYGDAHYNLGRTLVDLWKLDEAGRCFAAARAMGVPEAKARNNAGLVLYRQGSVAAAIAEYNAALASDSGSVDAHWNLAHALLHMGELREGWKEFEWRWRRADFQKMRSLRQAPWWDGTALPGRTILLWAEQGFGDVLHFLRFVPAVASQGMRVILECPMPLHRLASTVSGVAGVIAPGSDLPHHDVQLALMSLPAVLGHSAVPEFTRPYLSVDDSARKRWEAHFGGCGSALRAGVVWAGSSTNPAGRYRSIPLDQLAELAGVSGVQFVSLQKGDASMEFAGSLFAPGGMDRSEELTDFAETAALIAVLDIVITIDTAVAHLAGALGKEVWLMLSKHHDWRWGISGDTTSWYPSVRLLRQERQGDWSDVVARCRRMLEQRVSFEGSANNGVALIENGCPHEALRDLQRAVALAPDHPGVHFNHALALLACGDWAQGFAEYEWRLLTSHGYSSRRPYEAPRWRGEPLSGKTIFVYAEQGFGDAIQFIRYASVLDRLGARVIVEARSELTSLVRMVPGVSEVIVRGDLPPAFDYHTPLLSVPWVLGTTPDTVPSAIPYIVLPAALRSQIPEPLRVGAGRPKIGLVWSGNKVSSIDQQRSLAPEEMLRYLPDRGITYVSLQTGPAQDKSRIDRQDMSMLDAGPWIKDFADSAHLILHLDAVVSVDTAAAHLAGALGKPVFTLVPVHADWRWLTGSDRTPWYPTMRLRRQKVRGQWQEALQEIAKDLHQFEESHDWQQ